MTELIMKCRLIDYADVMTEWLNSHISPLIDDGFEIVGMTAVKQPSSNRDSLCYLLEKK